MQSMTEKAPVHKIYSQPQGQAAPQLTALC